MSKLLNPLTSNYCSCNHVIITHQLLRNCTSTKTDPLKHFQDQFFFFLSPHLEFLYLLRKINYHRWRRPNSALQDKNIQNKPVVHNKKQIEHPPQTTAWDLLEGIREFGVAKKFANKPDTFLSKAEAAGSDSSGMFGVKWSNMSSKELHLISMRKQREGFVIVCAGTSPAPKRNYNITKVHW